jgi:hypothetical protein
MRIEPWSVYADYPSMILRPPADHAGNLHFTVRLRETSRDPDGLAPRSRSFGRRTFNRNRSGYRRSPPARVSWRTFACSLAPRFDHRPFGWRFRQADGGVVQTIEQSAKRGRRGLENCRQIALAEAIEKAAGVITGGSRRELNSL